MLNNSLSKQMMHLSAVKICLPSDACQCASSIVILFLFTKLHLQVPTLSMLFVLMSSKVSKRVSWFTGNVNKGKKKEKIKLDSSLRKRKKNSNSCLCQLFFPYLVECEVCPDGSIASHKRIILHVPECPWPVPCTVQPVEFSQDLRLVLRNHT